MASSTRVGGDIIATIEPSAEWTEAHRELVAQAKEQGVEMQVNCPIEEREVVLRLRAALVVPLAMAPQNEWPVFKVDLGPLLVQDGENVKPARIKLTDLYARAEAIAREKAPVQALMVSRALAEQV